MSVGKINNIGGGTKLPDINPTKATSGKIPGYLQARAYNSDSCIYMPVVGWDNISIFAADNTINYYRWCLSDGTETSNVRLTYNVWTDLTKPDDAVCVVLQSEYPSQTYAKYYYSFTN